MNSVHLRIASMKFYFNYYLSVKLLKNIFFRSSIGKSGITDHKGFLKVVLGVGVPRQLLRLPTRKYGSGYGNIYVRLKIVSEKSSLCFSENFSNIFGPTKPTITCRYLRILIPVREPYGTNYSVGTYVTGTV